MKPICIPCQRFFRMKKSGFYFIEGMPKEGNPPPGKAQPEAWRPYKLYAGDIWECPGCGSQIIVGAGEPIAEHFQSDFDTQINRHGATLIVKDC